jgi:hypothetical protein
VVEPKDGAKYKTFNEKMIARAPYTGQYYLADSHHAHNLITGFLQGEKSESWIRNIARYQDGCRDIIALRNHYDGEGSSTRRISDANGFNLHFIARVSEPSTSFLTHYRRC